MQVFAPASGCAGVIGLDGDASGADIVSMAHEGAPDDLRLVAAEPASTLRSMPRPMTRRASHLSQLEWPPATKAKRAQASMCGRYLPLRDPRKEHTMKISTPLVAASLCVSCGAALATEYGNVLSSTPVTAQVAVPQQQCTDQQVLMPPRTSGGGALLGAIVGGVVGHNLGDGFGRAAATGLGVVAGSVIGDRAEAANTPPTEVPVRTCQTVTGYQQRIVGYDVVYEYNGQRYATRMTQDPGARIALSIAPAAATVIAAAGQPVPMAAPAVVYTAVPAYPYYGPYGAYGPYGYGGYYGGAAVTVVPRFVIGGGYRRHGF